MAVEPRLMTAEELRALPDDGMRHELIDGVLRTMVPPGDEHGRAASAIHVHLGQYVLDNPTVELRAAETGFLLQRDPDRVRAPDVAVILRERLPSEGFVSGYFVGAPDLAVEVVSPSDTAAEVLEKVADWLAAGARLVWVAYPVGPRLFVHAADGSVKLLGPDDQVDGGDVLPHFRMRVVDLVHPYRR
jgi:Uma2 family endonuclease